MGRSLVLNATDEPLCIVPSRRAVVLVLKSKAEIIEANASAFHSEKAAIPVPSVVRLTYFVKVPYRARATLSRRAVFIRDGYECQYCGAAAENVDHVQPRSKGGPHTWENVVASCRRCNSRKENRTAAEVGLKLRRIPRAPRGSHFLVVAAGKPEPSWEPYLVPEGLGTAG
ncbi:MAG TPA: HNH endonuclease [Actinomycetota bacterium]|nr:HNH endonuclease [Actinomycetota bacterium]